MYEKSYDSNYEIQSVLNDKIIDGKLYYFVKWKGYPHSQNSWEPEQHLKNVPQHLSAWKEMKNKLRKLDKVSKRKKDEESFDGKKYIKKNRPPGPVSGENKQSHQIYRKSKRIQEKDDTPQSRLTKDFDFQKVSDNRSQQSDKNSSKNSHHSSKNSIFSVLSQINKINKKREETQKQKNFLEDQKNPITSQIEVQKQKRGRKKKMEKPLSKQQSNQISLKKCSKEKNHQQKEHKNYNFNKDEKTFQYSYNEEMLRKDSSFEKKRKKSMVQSSNDAKNKKNFDIKASQNKNLQWDDSPLSLFEQKQIFPQQNKNAAVFDELQQIALSNSKRMPNFLDMYGLRSNYHYVETKKKNVQIPNPTIQKQTHNRFIRPPTNEMSKSGIEISSGTDTDESLMVIQEEDFIKGVKGKIPGKKIFLNEEYQQVSVNVDTKRNNQFQPINHFKSQNCTLQQPIPDPRYVHLAKIAGQSLYDFLHQNSALKRFRMKPLEYINALKKRTKNEIQKKGVCIDLNELERREVQRNWCVQNENEEVWVSQQKDSKQITQQDFLNSVNLDVPKPQLPQARKQTLPLQEFHPIYLSDTSQSQRQISKSMIPSQQSGDIELLTGLENDILDLFMQRYPMQPITFEIKEEISRIVRKIAYENMEMETGLRMIEDWMEGCRAEMISTEKNQKSKESEGQEENQNELISNDKEKESRSNLETDSFPKPTITVDETFIVKIVNQFYYKNEKCFNLLLKNNQKVNAHYLQLKKNCPKVLFQYYETKCKQFQQKLQKMAKQNIFLD